MILDVLFYSIYFKICNSKYKEQLLDIYSDENGYLYFSSGCNKVILDEKLKVNLDVMAINNSTGVRISLNLFLKFLYELSLNPEQLGEIRTRIPEEIRDAYIEEPQEIETPPARAQETYSPAESILLIRTFINQNVYPSYEWNEKFERWNLNEEERKKIIYLFQSAINRGNIEYFTFSGTPEEIKYYVELIARINLLQLK